MAIRNGIFKVRNASTGEKDEVMLKTTIAQVDDLNKLTGATASAAGVWGLAPAPAKGSQNLPLCGDAKYKVLPVEGGGTGANTVADAVQALFGGSAVGSSTKSIYYDGKTLKACADSIGGGGIVAQLLEQNGYVKFANGLILQWGLETSASEVVTYPIPVSRVLCLLLTTKAITFRYSPWPTEITVKSFRGMSDCEPAYWFLVAKQQWGLDVSTPNGSYVKTISFPIPFAKAVYAITCTINTVSDNEILMLAGVEVRTISTKNFKMQASHYNHQYPMIKGVFWIAAGR